MNLKSRIEQERTNPAGLERLYRQTAAAGEETAFREAITQCLEEYPDNSVMAAWAYRLDMRPIPDDTALERPSEKQRLFRHWGLAVATGSILGAFFVLFAGGNPPVPIPGPARPLFWIGWGPLMALGVLFYLTAVKPVRTRIRWHSVSAIVLLLITVYTAFTAWERTDDVAILIALHLPLIAWAIMGAGLIYDSPDPSRQGYAFLMKSVETMMTGGVYFGAGMLFTGLTLGIFAALGITLAETTLRSIAAWGIGVIPILALASVYDPTTLPSEQNWNTGLARLLTILTRLILPPALGVLIVYILWFIPTHFWRPFEEREVLIVYNATIMAILVLMATVVTGGADTPQSSRMLRHAALSLGILTLLLNLYALAATISRTAEYDLTPNRYAVLGWNLVTLLMLSALVFQLGKNRSEPWIPVFRKTVFLVSIPAVIWILWVVVGLPLSFL